MVKDAVRLEPASRPVLRGLTPELVDLRQPIATAHRVIGVVLIGAATCLTVDDIGQLGQLLLCPPHLTG